MNQDIRRTSEPWSLGKASNARWLFGALLLALVSLGLAPRPAEAHHSWRRYHWARTANPFTLQLGDNVSETWDPYLVGASSDWTQSSVLDTPVVAGGIDPKLCGPTAQSEPVEVCAADYGDNGWLGHAQIWVSGSHITQGTAKMNDHYFNTPTYDTPAWRRFVMCQEVGHTFGLDHQDENFYNPNLGSCMDYTSDPDGPPSNEHPNPHDYDQLEKIYKHLDGTSTVGATTSADAPGFGDRPDEWGRVVRTDAEGRPSVYERDLGDGRKVFTFVIWTR